RIPCCGIAPPVAGFPISIWEFGRSAVDPEDRIALRWCTFGPGCSRSAVYRRSDSSSNECRRCRLPDSLEQSVQEVREINSNHAGKQRDFEVAKIMIDHLRNGALRLRVRVASIFRTWNTKL